MARYLVQISPERREEIKAALSSLGVPIIRQVFDIIAIDTTAAMVTEIRTIPGVINISPEKEHRIMTIPVTKKLAEFQRLFLSNPITGPISAFSYSLAEEKDRWLCSESRKVLGADVAESEGFTGRGVKICIVDTGSDPLSPQSPRILAESCMTTQPIGIDEVGHGQHILSILAGKELWTPRGIIKGIAPDAEILAIKVLGGGTGTGNEIDILEGIARAAEWKANLVNLSVGTESVPGEYDATTRLVDALAKEGIICVCAIGNFGIGILASPGVADGALAVGAIDKGGIIADWSSRRGWKSQKPETVAPGLSIYASSVGWLDLMEINDPPRTASLSGTSQACAAVTGLMALWLQYAHSKGRILTIDNIKEIMPSFGDSWSSDYGWGAPHFNWVKGYLG